MSGKNLWKKVAIIISLTFLLGLFAVDLNALLFQGKIDQSQAQALKVKVELKELVVDPKTGSWSCPTDGYNCIVMSIASKRIEIPLTLSMLGI